jgi:transcriptional regulator with XRE-family HTH domain
MSTIWAENDVVVNVQDPTDADIGARIRTERLERGWSLTALAERSGVSRAMINKVERGESSPTASLLGRLSGAFGLTLSTLLARAEGARGGRLARAADQPRWQDPASGYVRRQIAPVHGSDIRLELVHVELPPGASIAFPASSYVFMRQVILVLGGHLAFIEGDTTHELQTGDCLELGSPADCTFRNETDSVCTYLVAVVPR